MSTPSTLPAVTPMAPPKSGAVLPGAAYLADGGDGLGDVLRAAGGVEGKDRLVGGVGLLVGAIGDRAQPQTAVLGRVLADRFDLEVRPPHVIRDGRGLRSQRGIGVVLVRRAANVVLPLGVIRAEGRTVEGSSTMMGIIILT